MPLQLLTAPTAEPVSLVQAKTHLRIVDTSEDALVAGLIVAARAMCENRTQRSLVVSRWKLVGDSFPGVGLTGVPYGAMYTLPGHAITLPWGAVLQVVSITYLDMSGVRQTMPVADYAVDLASEPVRITPVFGKIWPIPLPQIGAVEVTFDSGHIAPISAVDTSADTITLRGWKTLVVGDTLRVQKRDKVTVNDGTLPTPLASYTDYYVQSVVSAGVYKLAATSGGTAIDITTLGAGDLFVGEIPQNLVSWMLLAMGTLYENRESVTVDQRITSVELPNDFLDGLLAPSRMVTY